MSRYYVYINDKQLGPYKDSEILEALQSGQYDWTDYVYDESKKEWVTFLQMPVFGGQFQAKATPPKPLHLVKEEKTEIKQEFQGQEWFVLKGDNRHGPFNFTDIIKMRQSGKLQTHDYLWRQNMSGWKKLAELKEFSEENVRRLASADDAKLSDVFFRRRHTRAIYGASIIVHDQKKVLKGDSIEISEGGAAVVLSTEEYPISQTLFLHFKPGDGVPPFNAICSVVNKNPNKNGGCKYGVKFTSISQSVQQHIRVYAEKEVKKSKPAA